MPTYCMKRANWLKNPNCLFLPSDDGGIYQIDGKNNCLRDFHSIDMLFFMSKLYLVATPIGNMGDITLRALEVLKSVSVIACEDTRHTALLLSKYDIHKRTIACHAYNEQNSAKGIAELLDAGEDVAYCSDAGTPCISDPGARLVEEVRRQGKHEIIPIPGASAVITLLSVAGNVGKTFTFEGFLSPKKGRRTKRVAELLARADAFIIYESPFRIVKTMKEIGELDPHAHVVCARELTKAFEEILTGSPDEVVAALEAKSTIKGEFAFVVVPGGAHDNDEEDTEPEA